MGFEANLLLLSLGEVDNTQYHEDKPKCQLILILSTKLVYKRGLSMREGEEEENIKPLILIHLETLWKGELIGTLAIT